MAPPRSSIKKLYYSIGEVSKITGLKQYVLRYWETEFKQLKPSKNRAGNRTYRQQDIDLVLKIKQLLYENKFTIEGARQQLSTANSGAEIEKIPEKLNYDKGGTSGGSGKLIRKIRQELEGILKEITKS